jgi:hypothetical protein
MQKQDMEIDYALTEEDYAELNLHANNIVPEMKWRYLIFRWVIPSAAVCYSIYLLIVATTLSEKISAILFVVMALLLFILAPRLQEMLIRRNVRAQMKGRQNSLLSESIRVSLQEDELLIKTASSENHFKWSVILNVTEIPTHYFLWISLRDAIIIPKRVFETPEQAREFIASVQRYREPHSLSPDLS